MNKLNMYFISLQANHLQKIKTFNYLPVGLGNSNFSNDWFRDDKGENI